FLQLSKATARFGSSLAATARSVAGHRLSTNCLLLRQSFSPALCRRWVATEPAIFSSTAASVYTVARRQKHTDLRPPKPTIAYRLVASAPAGLQPYLRLARLDRPIGTWLLYLPCAWSITLATPAGLLPDPLVLGLFGCGALLMRGAGCTMNDILDRDYDKRVERTEDRPIPSGQVTVPRATAFLIGQSLLAACVLFPIRLVHRRFGRRFARLRVTLNFGILIGYSAIQAHCFTFNYGALLGYAALTGTIDLSVCLPLYAAGFCWTMVYDTIYAHQDKEDDLIVGVKSTALLFGDATKSWLTGFTLGMSLLLATAGANANCGLFYHAGALYASLHLAQQVASVQLDNPADCLAKFKSNRNLGLAFWLAIVLDNFFGLPVPGFGGGFEESLLITDRISAMTSTPPMSTGANVADDSNPVERWFKAIDCARMSLVKEAYPAIDNVDVTKALPFGPKNTLHKDATALHLASYIGHKDIVRFLISSKADPNASTSLGYRPIHFAASEGHVTTVDILLNAGAEDGDTPVALALKWGMRDTVRKLLNSGATLDGLDDASLKKYAKRGFLPSQEAASPTRQSAAPSAGGRKGGGNVRQQQQQRHHYQGAGGGYSMGDSSTQRRWRELTSKFADAEVGSGGGADDSRSAAFTAVARCVRRLLADCRTEERLEARAATLASALRSAGPDLATAGDLAELLEMLAFDCGFPVSGSLADCLAGLRLRCRRIREGPGAWAVRLMRTAQDPSLDSHSVDASLCLCNALLSMEQAECTGRLAPAAEEFINQTLSALEGTEEPRHLVQLLALVRLSSELFESNFLAKFEQFADVLIGWSIDPGDSTEFALSKRLAACLTSLGRLWRANSNYTWQLLDSLVEDVSVFVNEELPSALAKATSGGGGARADSPVETAMAAAPLLETFATVLTALDNASCRQADDAADSASLNLQRLIGLLSRLSAHLSSLSAADLALCLGGGDQLRLAANQAIVSLLNAIKRRPGNGVGCLDNGLAEQLLNYLCDQLPAPGSQQQQQKQPMLRFPSNVYLTSLIELMSDLSTLTGPSLPVRSLFSAIGPYSVLHCAKLSPNPLLVRRVLSLFSGFIRLDDFRLTDAIYQTLISDLEQCLRVLVRLCGSDFEVNLVQENGFRDKRYSGSEAESLALFNCLALRELGRVSFADARPCLVRLQPPLFDLLATGYLPLHDAAVMRQQPRMHWALLRALQSHCQAHAYFYAYSPFCADSRTIGESDAVAAAASEEVDLSVRLQQLLQCLGALLASPGCPPKSAACAVACLTELAAAAVARDRRHSRRLFASPEIQLMLRRVARSLRLQSAPAYHSAAVRLMAACLSGAAAATSGDLGLGDEQYRHTFEVTLDSVFALLSTSDESLAAECLKLISLVPMEIYMRCLMAAATLAKQSRCLDDDVGQDAQGSSDLRGQWLGLRHHMMRTCEVTFSGPNLRLVLKYLLEGAKQPPFLYGLFLSCTPAARETKLAEASPDFASLLGQSRHVLSFQWFWATWEVSWFCVLNKLKVPPWNRAQDTFLAIEDALNRIVNQRLSANPADWHRSYCVLLFMEQLEKLVFNAYEGCALLSGLSHFKSVKYFFRTNKSTCLEWFHRTRPIVMQLCDRLDSPELVAREAFALLGETDASRYANQDDTLLLLVKSLCRMGQADCLHGLYAWCETRLGRRLLCVRAAAERADSKLESALQLYEQHLQDLLMNGIGRPGEVRLASKQTSGTAAYVRFCVTQIAECHEQLGNSRQLLAWQERLRKYAAEHALALPADCFQVPGVNFTYQ
uniref:4-hydroxybenzoate polyprenyltransferase, mitochondrial n=1 Tax=Macrostomum lignano TaxID=282301 RepID=A0A1I8G9T5_9PLAT